MNIVVILLAQMEGKGVVMRNQKVVSNRLTSLQEREKGSSRSPLVVIIGFKKLVSWRGRNTCVIQLAQPAMVHVLFDTQS